MHRLIDVRDRFHAMPLEIMLGGFQFFLGRTHVLQGFLDMRMPFRCRNWRRSDWRCCHRHRCWGRFRPRRSGGKGEGKQNCCHDELSQEPDLLQNFLLVRIATRTQPV